MNRAPIAALCALLAAGCAARQLTPGSTVAAAGLSSATRASIGRFAAEIDSLRQDLRIPGLAAAVVRDGELLWARGFGYSNRGWRTPVTPHTPFHLASLTKSVAATVLMQLVDKGKVGLDDPLTAWGIRLPGAPQVRDLLSHTSSGGYAYDGARYALLERIIAGASGLSFADRLYQGVLAPLAMHETAPNDRASWETFLVSLGLDSRRRDYARVYTGLARPYRVRADLSVGPGWYSLDQSTSAGIMSSVTDLAKLDMALDSGALMRAETRESMWRWQTSTSDVDGSLGYGLGWFVQYAYGLRLVWHYGIWPPSCSGLWLKVPEQRLTLILLANTDGLSAPFPLAEGDVLTSAFALAFARSFAFPRVTGEELPVVNWKAPEAELTAALVGVQGWAARDFVERELWSRRQLFANAGRWDLANRLFRARHVAFPDSWRESDRRYAATYAGFTEEEPRGISLRGIVWGGRAAALWLLATAVSLGLFLSGRVPRAASPFPSRLHRLPAVVVFGPAGLAVEWTTTTRPTPRRASRRALGSLCALASASLAPAMEIAAWYALVLLVAAQLAARSGSSFGLAAAALPALGGALLLGLLLRRSLRAAPGRGELLATLRRSLLPELLTTSIAAAVTTPLFLALERYCFSQAPDLRSPLFWLAIPAASFASLLLLVPLEAWVKARGAGRDDEPGSPLCRMGTVWPAATGCFLLLLLSAVLVYGLLR